MTELQAIMQASGRNRPPPPVRLGGYCLATGDFDNLDDNVNEWKHAICTLEELYNLMTERAERKEGDAESY